MAAPERPEHGVDLLQKSSALRTGLGTGAYARQASPFATLRIGPALAPIRRRMGLSHGSSGVRDPRHPRHRRLGRRPGGTESPGGRLRAGPAGQRARGAACRRQQPAPGHSRQERSAVAVPAKSGERLEHAKVYVAVPVSICCCMTATSCCGEARARTCRAPKSTLSSARQRPRSAEGSSAWCCRVRSATARPGSGRSSDAAAWPWSKIRRMPRLRACRAARSTMSRRTMSAA